LIFFAVFIGVATNPTMNPRKMNTKRTVQVILATILFAVVYPAANANEISVSALPPSVVKTVPEAGSVKVDPALKEIRVTFSKDMTDRSWSITQTSPESFPEINGSLRFIDKRTCVIPVKLEPGKSYVLWFNRGQFMNFRDSQGNASVPYQLVFETRP
jgi:hypothetical protein